MRTGTACRLQMPGARGWIYQIAIEIFADVFKDEIVRLFFRTCNY